MAKCNECGKKGLFLKVNKRGYCKDCAEIVHRREALADLERRTQEAEAAAEAVKRHAQDSERLFKEATEQARTKAQKALEAQEQENWILKLNNVFSPNHAKPHKPCHEGNAKAEEWQWYVLLRENLLSIPPEKPDIYLCFHSLQSSVRDPKAAGERWKRCPSGAFALSESALSESAETSGTSGSAIPRRLRLRKYPATSTKSTKAHPHGWAFVVSLKEEAV